VLDFKALPAHLLINGDLAHLHGRAGDYAAAVGLLEPLRRAGVPVHVALGNHDSRTHFRAALPAASFADGVLAPSASSIDRQVTFLELPRANVLLLDSLKTTNAMRGAIGRAQLQWLAETLDANPDKPALVFVHHHPEIGFSLMPGGIADTAALLDVLSPRRQAKALFFGHTHVWSHKQRHDGLHLVNLPATAYTFSFRQPAAWVDARLFARGATLNLHRVESRHVGRSSDAVHMTWRT
jgi:3',5'-cyclic AMP phosphodiesterase CpdA